MGGVAWLIWPRNSRRTGSTIALIYRNGFQEASAKRWLFWKNELHRIVLRAILDLETAGLLFALVLEFFARMSEPPTEAARCYGALLQVPQPNGALAIISRR